MEKAKFPAGSPLFEGMPKEQLQKLERIVREMSFERGENVFSEGEDAKGFYVVLTGMVKIYKLSRDGKEQIMHIFGPGEIFGEVPVFMGGNYPANADALDKCTVAFLPRDAFVKLIGEEPSAAMNMLAALSRRLRQFTHLVENLSLKEVPGRLASYLLYICEQEGQKTEIKLDIPKGQLASLLGTIPETLSRILGKMTAEGIINVKGRNIQILNQSALANLASGKRSI